MEDVPSILGSISSCLPAADFGIGDSEDDSGDNEEGGGAEVGVFSRSQHLQTLGLGKEFLMGSDHVGAGVELPPADCSIHGTGDQSHDSSLIENTAEGLAVGILGKNLTGDFSSSAAGEIERTDSLKLSLASESSQSDLGSEAEQGGARMAASSVLNEALDDAPPPTSSSSGEQDEEQWQRFKSDFADSLQGSKTQLHEAFHSHSTRPVVESLRQQLLIDAIAAMHSVETENGEEDETNRILLHSAPAPDDERISCLSTGTAVARTQHLLPTSTVGQSSTQINLHSLDSSSPSGGRHSLHAPASLQGGHAPYPPVESLLSVGTLETIPELELDQLLESVGCEGAEVQQVGVSGMPSRKEPHPPPGFTWEVGVASAGSGDLMQQLERLNEERWEAGPVGRRDTPTTAGKPDSKDLLSPTHQSAKGWNPHSIHHSEAVSPTHHSEAVSPTHHSEAVSPTHHSEAVSPAHQSEAVSPTHHSEAVSPTHQSEAVSPAHPPAEDTTATVFLDLRPTRKDGARVELPTANAINTGVQGRPASEGAEEERSSSDSEDNSDPYSWLAQRQQLKDNLPPSTPPSSSHTPHNLHTSQKAAVLVTRTADQSTSAPVASSRREPANASSGKNKGEGSLRTPRQSASSSPLAGERNPMQSDREQHKSTPRPAAIPAALKLEGHLQHDSSVAFLSRDAHVSDSDHNKVFYRREITSGSAGSERRSIGTSTEEDGVMKVSSLSSLSEEEAIVPADHITSEEVGFQVERHRSGDSLTLSSEFSSPSEGEVVSSKPPAGKSAGKKSTSKKAKKKSKKDKKEEEKVRSGKKSGGKSKGQHRKAEGQRRRADSLTGTSSEEEPAPEPSRRMAGVAGEPPVAAPTVLVEEGGAGGGAGGRTGAVDTERLKLQLQQRIESRKPPSNFETPAAHPLFHPDVSFGPLLTSLDPAALTNALLLLPLSEYGLASVPGSLAPPTHQALHCLLLTWLSSAAAWTNPAAAEAISKGRVSSEDDGGRAVEVGEREIKGTNPQSHDQSHDTGSDHSNRTGISSATPVATGRRQATESDDRSPPVLSSRGDSPLPSSLPAPPFQVTGMQQTIFDGNPAIIVGVALPQGRGQSEPHPLNVNTSVKSPAEVDPAPHPLESILSMTKLKDALGLFLESSTVRDSIPVLSLQQLEPIFDLPLSSIFSIQVGHTPMTTPTSFYWHSRYHPSCLPGKESLGSHARLQTTVCTLGPQTLSNPSLTFSVLHRIYCSGLDLAGIRLVFGESASCIDTTAPPCPTRRGHTPTLALAIRGPDALFTWLEVCGPEDSALARITDPLSISALFGSYGNIMHCVRTPYRVSVAIAKWFGGRACLRTGSVLGVSDFRTKSERRKRQRVRFSESESEDSLPSPLPDVTFPPLVSNRPLLATGYYSKMCLVVSPHVPPPCYASILASCSRMGYDIFGVKRLRLNSKRAKALQIPPSFITHFTPSSTPPSPALTDFVSHPLLPGCAQIGPPLPSVLLVLGRENALLHTDALRRNIHTDLLNLLEQNPVLEEQIGRVANSFSADALFHTTEHTEDALRVLVGQIGSPTLSQPDSKLASWWEGEQPLKEEIGFLAVTQSGGLQRVVRVLNSIYRIKPSQAREHSGSSLMELDSRVEEEDDNSETDFVDLGEFELLGMKLFPQLSRFHAKQLCPFTPKDQLYQDMVLALSDSPALMLLFRGINCNRRLQKVLPKASTSPLHTASLQQSLNVILSPSFSKAFHLASIFFADKELFCDSSNSPLAAHVPPSWVQDSDILLGLQREPEVLLSVLAVDGAQMKLLIKVLEKLSRTGFTFVAMTLHSEDMEQEAVLEVGATGAKLHGDTKVVVCVESVNAVWLLQHQLQPFTLGSEAYKQALSFPKDFGSAVADIRHYFPGGICCQATTITREYGLSCPAIDDFAGIVPGDLSPVPSSPLLETTCVLLPLPSKAPVAQRCITLLELTSQARFQICGLRLSQLSEDRAREICFACSTSIRAEDLYSVPCLILVLARDNAAACFKMILKSTVHTSYRGSAEEVEELLAGMIIPNGANEARKVMAVFQN